jgi:enoyl-CoA hydratase
VEGYRRLSRDELTARIAAASGEPEPARAAEEAPAAQSEPAPPAAEPEPAPAGGTAPRPAAEAVAGEVEPAPAPAADEPPAPAAGSPRTAVDVDIDGPLATLTLRGATRENTLALATLEELAAAAEAAARRPGVRLVAITGAGDRIFSAGADLGSLAGVSGAEITRRGTAACNRIAALDVPTLALLNGHAVGGAVDLALACDWRMAAAGAKLRFIHNELGYSPPWGAARRLPEIVPRGVALRLFATCQTLTARQAKAIGVVDDVVEGSALAGHARALAARVEHAGAGAVAATKRLLSTGTPAAHEADFARSWDGAKLSEATGE